LDIHLASGKLRPPDRSRLLQPARAAHTGGQATAKQEVHLHLDCDNNEHRLSRDCDLNYLYLVLVFGVSVDRKAYFIELMYILMP